VEATTGRLGELIGKMGGKRARLEWAINFIQEDLQAAGPGRRADLRRELTVFTRAWDVSRDDEWTPEGVRFFSEEEMREALADRMGKKEADLKASFDALSLGMRHGKR